MTRAAANQLSEQNAVNLAERYRRGDTSQCEAIKNPQ